LSRDNARASADDFDSSPAVDERPWKILVIDDDQDVHNVTRLVLMGFSYKDRGLQLIHGYSGAEACRLLEQHPDTAVILLDVIMETDNAGLEAVQYIRENLHNHRVRIILRTGQAGSAPAHKVARLYDINDYLEKSRATIEYLEETLVNSLRAFDDIGTANEPASRDDKPDHP
jgi:CheY-like chemotaxis protein